MITLRRIEIHRLRNVRPGTAIELHPGTSVLLGRNGSGKTTLLQWLADLLSGSVHARAGGHPGAPQGEPYDLTLALQASRVHATIRLRNDPGPRDAHALAAQGDRAPRIEMDMAFDTPEGRYELRVEPPRLTLSCPDRAPLELDAAGFRFDAPAGALRFALTTSEREHGHDRPESLHSFLESLGDAYLHARRFDESLELYASLTGRGEQAARLVFLRMGDVILGGHHLLIPDALRQRVEAHLAGLGRPGPDAAQEARQEARQEAKQTPAPTSLCFADADLPFLAEAVESLGVASATAEISLLEKQVSGEAETHRFGDLRFSFQRRDGSIISHDQLSYGQKRLLAFHCYLDASPRLVLADELVNGLHHAWIESCIAAIGSRQAILSSQNPLLLGYLSFASPDELRRRIVLCETERHGHGEQVSWRNPGAKEAKALFTAHESGLQRMAELLHAQGLW